MNFDKLEVYAEEVKASSLDDAKKSKAEQKKSFLLNERRSNGVSYTKGRSYIP